MTPNSPQELIEEFTDVLASSFCGDYCSPPEAMLSWCFKSPEMTENDHTKTLSNDMTKGEGWKHRTEFYRNMAEWTFLHARRHGGCFALKDPNPEEDSDYGTDDDGDEKSSNAIKNAKIVAVAVVFPPNNKRGLGEERAPKVPRDGDEPQVRFALLKKTLKLSHDTHFPGGRQCMYIHSLGVAPGSQGQGHGRTLITLIGECADRMKVPCYLETAGTACEGFFGHNGYKVERRYPLVYNVATEGGEEERSFKPDGLDGFAAMIRPCADSSNRA